ncbi:hypothetical protein K7X08_033133 [Anisodus acutangulus]|uniref:Secreted protein n=1 Tax=Anisodus acutangulus TaxID=402998 RepID=A0A9Q1M3M8_9SOLA|nr:hypothetical protein K7X08_033133 [Anisodus acutangulus]
MLQGSGASFMFVLAVGSIPMMSMTVFGSANCFEKPRPPPTGGIAAGGGEIACSSTSTSTSASSRSIGSRRRMDIGGNNVDGGRGKTCPSVMLVKAILPSLVLR